MTDLKVEFYMAVSAIAGWAQSQEALYKYSAEQNGYNMYGDPFKEQRYSD